MNLLLTIYTLSLGLKLMYYWLKKTTFTLHKTATSRSTLSFENQRKLDYSDCFFINTCAPVLI